MYFKTVKKSDINGPFSAQKMQKKYSSPKLNIQHASLVRAGPCYL